MAVTGQNIADKVELLLQDETNVRWTENELLGWINSAQREIAIAKPNALTSNTTMALTAGSTKQTIPNTGIQLLDVVRNMGAAGATPGRAITGIDRNILDVTIPTWHSDANTGSEVKHFVFDARDPKTFYVYPRAPATALYVELIMSINPTVLASLASNISYDDVYEGVVIDYVLYRAYSKDSEHTANQQRAAGHYQAFQTALGLKSRAEAALAPEMMFATSTPGARAIPAPNGGQ